MAKQGVAVIILSILLVLALGYIGYVSYNQVQQNKQITAYATFEQGAQYGVQQGAQQAIMQIMQQASTCQPVELYAENVSMHVIPVECPAIQSCLEMAQQIQSAQPTQ